MISQHSAEVLAGYLDRKMIEVAVRFGLRRTVDTSKLPNGLEIAWVVSLRGRGQEVQIGMSDKDRVPMARVRRLVMGLPVSQQPMTVMPEVFERQQLSDDEYGSVLASCHDLEPWEAEEIKRSMRIYSGLQQLLLAGAIPKESRWRG